MNKKIFLVPIVAMGVSLVACNKEEATTFKVKCDYDDVELTSYQASKGKTYNTSIELTASAIERAATLPDEPVVTISNNPFTNYSYVPNAEKTKADFTIEGKYITGDIKIELDIYYPEEYTVIWDLGDGTTYEEKYYEGEMPTYPYGPVVREDSAIIDNYYQTSYIFTEWLDDDNQGIHRVDGDETYYAQYKEKSAVSRFILSGSSVNGKMVEFNYTGSSAVKINWGDGNILDTQLTSGSASHAYQNITDEYVIISVFGKVTSIAFSGRNSSGLIETLEEGNLSMLCASLSSHIETIKEDAFAGLTALNTFFIPSNVINVEKEIAIYSDRTGTELNFYIENSEIISTWDATWNAVVPSSKPQLYPVYHNVHALGVDDSGFTYVSVLYNGYEELAITGYYGSTTLTDIVIPENENVNGVLKPVTAIMFAPFEGTYIKSLTLPNSIDCIGKSSFKNCSYLETITVSSSTNEGRIWPKYLEKIDTDAFRGCSSLSIELDFTSNVYLTSIGSGAFYGTPITSLKLGSSIKSVGNLAFCSCSKLATVDLENATNLTVISDGMFQNARITSLRLHDLITDIGNNAFASGIGTSLGEKLVLPSKLKSIGSQAFYNMPNTIALDASAYQIVDDIPSGLPNILNNGGAGFDIYIFDEGLKDFFLEKSWPSRANYIVLPQQ